MEIHIDQLATIVINDHFKKLFERTNIHSEKKSIMSIPLRSDEGLGITSQLIELVQYELQPR
jgi:hypothetical protein